MTQKNKVIICTYFVNLLFCYFVVVCLQKEVIHPDTKEPLSLPLTRSGIVKDSYGDCKGERIVMLTATCFYNRTSRLSSWTAFRFRKCPVDCLAKVSTHSVSRQSFTLPTALNGQNYTHRGECGHHEQDMVFAMCNDGEWILQELNCTITCLAGQINHPQWPESLPSGEIPVGSLYRFQLLCNGVNRTVLTADCALNPDGTKGIWLNLNKEDCSASCNSTTWFHPNTQLHYTINSTALGKQSIVSGRCGGKIQTLLIANCTGDVFEGAYWTYSALNCSPSCEAKNSIHPDTGASIIIPSRFHGKIANVTGICNGVEAELVSAVCGGNITEVPYWLNVTYQNCTGYCGEVNVTHADGEQYLIRRAAIGQQVQINSSCALVPFVKLSATCTGSAINGGTWNYSTYRFELL